MSNINMIGTMTIRKLNKQAIGVTLPVDLVKALDLKQGKYLYETSLVDGKKVIVLKELTTG